MTYKKEHFHTKSKWRNKWFCCFISLGDPLLTADNEERARPITRYSKELVNSAFALFVFARNGLSKNSTTWDLRTSTSNHVNLLSFPWQVTLNGSSKPPIFFTQTPFLSYICWSWTASPVKWIILKSKRKSQIKNNNNLKQEAEEAKETQLSEAQEAKEIKRSEA